MREKLPRKEKRQGGACSKKNQKNRQVAKTETSHQSRWPEWNYVGKSKTGGGGAEKKPQNDPGGKWGLPCGPGNRRPARSQAKQNQTLAGYLKGKTTGILN